MPVLRKRRAQSPEQSRQSIPTPSQKSISHYGRVTKTQRGDQSVKKRKALLDQTIKVTLMEEPIESRPRRGQTPPVALPKPSDIASDQPEVRSSRKRKNDAAVETPQPKRLRNAIPPTPAETPSKAAVHLFDKLSIEAPTSRISTKQEIVYDTPPLTPKLLGDPFDLSSVDQLPSSLQDLVRLFSSFLTSTSLYYAHNGSGSPLQIAFVLQNITKAWKRRAVTEIDLRRLLGVLGPSNFEIVDNGDGMICLDQVETMAAGHFNQLELKSRFESNLSQYWREWISTSPRKRQEVEAFLNQLPLAEIHEGDLTSVKPTGSAKGRERLNDLKKSAVKARSDDNASQRSLVTAESKTSAAVLSRGSSLLDRILAKQMLTATQGNGPTQEEIDRKTALNRIEDVLPVMDVLAGSRPRVSFSTQTIVSHLQNSLRNPISREEAERCLEFMASEITPGFLSLIKSGQVKGVVLTRGGRPSNVELKQRLERAGA